MKSKKTVAFVEIFTTNIQSDIQAKHILKTFENNFPELKINFDFSEVKLSYPCGHSILRVEGNAINSENIISTMHQSGFKCDILEDKMCN